MWKSSSEDGEEGVIIIVGVAPVFSDICGTSEDANYNRPNGNAHREKYSRRDIVGTTRGGKSKAIRERGDGAGAV